MHFLKIVDAMNFLICTSTSSPLLESGTFFNLYSDSLSLSLYPCLSCSSFPSWFFSLTRKPNENAMIFRKRERWSIILASTIPRNFSTSLFDCSFYSSIFHSPISFTADFSSVCLSFTLSMLYCVSFSHFN